MADSYDLTQLDPASFEHMVNLLAMNVLGSGHTGFGPGSDGGRDGYFEGEAPYPSNSDRWSGAWYIQSKFHKPQLSTDPQKWLLGQVQAELAEFTKENTKRKWPDIWIIATNIDPSGVPETGSFDSARKLVEQVNPKLKTKFHIWGGRKILDLLISYPEIAEYYGHFLTPGNVITSLYNQITDAQAEIESILHYLVVKQFSENQYTKLEQAGANPETRPRIHQLFIDLPFQNIFFEIDGLVMRSLTHSSARNHKPNNLKSTSLDWAEWNRHPSRAKVLFIKGGPGQGKSTISQYYSQIQRASLILQGDNFTVSTNQIMLANEIKEIAEKMSYWPSVPRIPLIIELKDYAQWFGGRSSHIARGILTFLAERMATHIEQPVHVGTLKRALRMQSWFVAFDGLDEVPSDIKDLVALEVTHFIEDVALENKIDLLSVCTSRPQGYSGQFSTLDGPTLNLTNLTSEQALACAQPILAIDRSEEEALKYFNILRSAVDSPSVRELMTTPLQAHIMAVVVRDGSRPPERRWQLFNNFYQVVRKREANRNLPNKELAKLLREDEQLLKSVHNRLGFILHMRAETSKGAQTHLHRDEFRSLVKNAVSEMIEDNIDHTVDVLLEATTERLVLVTTPDDGDHVRFDIRQLQEFFAAEFLYEVVESEQLRERLEIIAGDSHWREVIYFLLSALIENNRKTELSIAIQILEQLDGGDEESGIRLLNRRLAHGALLSARLLQEGVLEQDKRVRQLFRRCLEPITAIYEFEAIDGLSSINQSNSRAWLINFLFNSLRENNYSENMLSASVLAFLIQDNDIRSREFREYLLSSPPHFLLSVMDYRSALVSNDEKIQDWLLQLLLELYLLEGFKAYVTLVSDAFVYQLRLDKQKTKTLAFEAGYSEEEVEILEWSILNDEFPIEENEEFTIGFVSGFYAPNYWADDSSWFNSSTLPTFCNHQSARGFFGFIALSCRLIIKQDYKDFKKFLSYLDDDSSLCMFLPNKLNYYFLFNQFGSIENQIEQLKGLDSNQFKIWFQMMQEARIPSGRLKFSDEITLENARNLLDKNFFIFLNLWEGNFGFNKVMSSILDLPEVVIPFIDKIMSNNILRPINYFTWGKLINLVPHREDELRNALISTKLSGFIRDNLSIESVTFQLRLPSEAFLLEPLAEVVTNRIITRIHTGELDSYIEQSMTILKLSITDPSALEEIVFVEKYDNKIRANAAILLALHPASKVTLQDLTENLLNFYDGNNSILLSNLTRCLLMIRAEECPILRLFVARLIDKARNDYQGLYDLQTLVAHWREISSAPLHSKGMEDKWLCLNI